MDKLIIKCNASVYVIVNELMHDIHGVDIAELETLRKGLELLRGAGRGDTVRAHMRTNKCIYEQHFLSEASLLAVRAAASMLVLIDTIENGVEIYDANMAVIHLVEYASGSSIGLQLALVDILSASANACVQSDHLLACSMGRILLSGVVVGSLCIECVNLMRNAKFEIGNKAVCEMLRAWSMAERALWGGVDGLDVRLRIFRESIRHSR